MVSVCFSISCLVFLSIIAYFYYSKSRLNNIDNKLFSTLLITNLIGIFIDVSGYLFFQVFPIDGYINSLIAKIYLIYYLFFTSILLVYIYSLTFRNLEKVIKKFRIFLFIISFMLAFMHIEVHPNYMAGIAVSFAYFWGFIFILLMIYCLIKNRKKVLSRVYIPLFAFMFLTLLSIIIQNINPEITILLLSNTIVTMLMYFTIENPDLKVLEEVSKIKDLTEKANEEKSTFLYSVTDEVNSILNLIDGNIDAMLKSSDIDELNSRANDIKNILNFSRGRIKSTIDVSTIDSKELKLDNNKYNAINLFNSIGLIAKNKVSKDVDFRLNLSNAIPDELYGDSIKIKQVILSLINNSIKYTTEGFIELKVSCIIKLDVCRLIINIEDSGSGIDLVKQNEILSNHEDLNKEEISNKYTDDLNLKTIRKIINIIGGTFAIESLNSSGTIVYITLDQKMVKSENSGAIDSNIKRYDELINARKRIAVISENKNTIATLKSLCKKMKYDFEYFDITLNCLNNIRNKINYDIVVIDENMDKISASSFLSKVSIIESFNGKVFVVTNKKDINIKKKYSSEGFNAILVNPLAYKDIKDYFL